MISQETIKEFQKVTKEEFGVLLSEIDAKEILIGTVAYLDTLAKIDSRRG